MTRHLFDDANLPWRSLDTIEHLHYWILDIDRQNKIVDVVFKFAANQQIVLHRHKVPNKTFVIQGEHRLYEADGRLKEIRPVGSYTSSLPSDEPHREGAPMKTRSSFSAYAAMRTCSTRFWMMT